MDSVLFVGPLDRVLLLRTLPMLEGLRPVALAAIAQHAQERSFSRGTLLSSPDASAQAVYLIVEGEVEITRDGAASRRVQAGEAVGFIEMLSRVKQPLEVRASSDTVALELDWDAQIDVCEEHFPVVMQYISYLARLTALELQRQGLASAQSGPSPTTQQFGPHLNFVQRVLVLSRSRAFSSGCLDALSELSQHVEEVRWEDGDPIWATGEAAEDFFLLASGLLRCSQASGVEFTCGPGKLAGVHEALYGSERWYAAVSEGPTIGLKIDLEPFVDILEDHFDLALDFMGLLAADLLSLQSGDG
ncbi:MAG: cyclic nucleotide-binding domain-containing protein [Gammaproteobacteria bacterium]|nr:cyclic nucleotide-binding domain-containing protein [Gammaproteobacteria bacterium]MDH3507497.1 cyclic nucleotide-binding domain-containing protein [Gammaproteobacteria bacterium]